MTKDEFTSFLEVRTKVASNHRFTFWAEIPDAFKEVSSSQGAFMHYLSGVIESYFEQSRRSDPDNDPVEWYQQALENIAGEYFKEDELIRQKYSTGIEFVGHTLMEQIFDDLPIFEYRSLMNRDFSFAMFSPTDEDLQRWNDNLLRWFSSDNFAIHTGIMETEDGNENQKEKIFMCPAAGVGTYMVRTGHKLITHYLKQYTPDIPDRRPSKSI